MKTCHYCTKKMKDSDLFCPRCGREYRDDFYLEKKTLTMEDDQDYVDSSKTKIPSMKKSPNLLAILVGLFLLFVFPQFAPILIIVFLAKTLTNKKRGK